MNSTPQHAMKLFGKYRVHLDALGDCIPLAFEERIVVGYKLFVLQLSITIRVSCSKFGDDKFGECCLAERHL